MLDIKELEDEELAQMDFPDYDQSTLIIQYY